MAKKKAKQEEQLVEIKTGQVSSLPLSDRDITVDKWKTTDILNSLTSTQDKIEAIDLIIDKTPDGKMAYNTYLRIANQGIKIEATNMKTGKVIKKYDKEIRDLCARLGGNNSEGLDGLLDQLHGSAVAHGGMAVEVVVMDDLSDIEDVVVIDPKTITEFKYIESERRYAAYQDIQGIKRDLYEGNFFWIPHQPKPGRPDGTLQFEPAIAILTQIYQLIKDSMTILYRTGSPKYDVIINLEKLLAAATAEQKSSTDELNKYLKQTFETISTQMASVSRDSNIIHFDSTELKIIGGGVNGSGIDIRAWFDVFEPFIVNAFQLTPVLMGRLSSGSYSLGTAEYKIVKDTMEVLRRSSKRMLENILNLWARVKGYAITITVTHNPIEWEVQKTKLETDLLKLEKARRAEEYQYISHEEAAAFALGDKADPQGQQLDFYEYLQRSFTTETSQTGQSNQSSDGNNQQQTEPEKQE